MNNNLRFISQDQYNELIGLYHLANVALAGGENTKYNRMIWASKEMNKKYNTISSTAFYKDLDANMNY